MLLGFSAVVTAKGGSWEFLVKRESSERAKAHGKAQRKRRQGSRFHRFRSDRPRVGNFETIRTIILLPKSN